MPQRSLQILAFFVATLWLGVAAPPVLAYKWPGTTPSVGGVVAAKVIGQKCSGVLTAADMVELDAFLAKAASEQKANASAGEKIWRTIDETVKSLTVEYGKKYSGPKACDADAAEEARDMLARVRTLMASGARILPDRNDPNRAPDIGEAVTAKVTGEMCPGTLTGLELAELHMVIAKYYMAFAKSADDSDTLLTLRTYKDIETGLASGFGSWFDSRKGCTAEALQKAKEIAARAHRTEAATK